jgi:hypothetical protein
MSEMNRAGLNKNSLRLGTFAWGTGWHGIMLLLKAMPNAQLG